MGQLPAGQPLLAVPVDRGRLAARVVGAACRRDHLACSSPRPPERPAAGPPPVLTPRPLTRPAVESPLSLPPARRATGGPLLGAPVGAMRTLMPTAGRQPHLSLAGSEASA